MNILNDLTILVDKTIKEQIPNESIVRVSKDILNRDTAQHKVQSIRMEKPAPK